MVESKKLTEPTTVMPVVVLVARVGHGIPEPTAVNAGAGKSLPGVELVLCIWEVTCSVVSGMQRVPTAIKVSVPSQGAETSTSIFAPRLHCSVPTVCVSSVRSTSSTRPSAI